MKTRNNHWTRPFGPGEHRVKPGTQRVGQRFKRLQEGFTSSTPQERRSVLPYYTWVTAGRMTSAGTLQYTHYPTAEDGQVPFVNSWGTNVYQKQAANKAYADFVEQFHNGRAQIATAMAEGRESFDMIAKRGRSLYNAYRALRKGDFRGALSSLSVQPKRKHRNVVRTSSSEASALWLEYHFGWSPMLGDIYDAAGILFGGHSHRPEPLVGKGRVAVPLTSSGFNSSFDSYSRKMSFEGTAAAYTGGEITITNYNHVLLAQMGMVNPFATAWEVVPFSFVADWMFSIGNVIEGWTDLMGTRVDNAFTTQIMRGRVYGSYGAQNARDVPTTYRWHTIRMRRTNGLLGPTLTVPRLINVASSKARAATSASLLRQLFVKR